MAVSKKPKPISTTMAEEFFRIIGGWAKGLVLVTIPHGGNKPRWCQCNKCGKWHNMAP